MACHLGPRRPDPYWCCRPHGGRGRGAIHAETPILGSTRSGLIPPPRKGRGRQASLRACTRAFSLARLGHYPRGRSTTTPGPDVSKPPWTGQSPSTTPPSRPPQPRPLLHRPGVAPDAIPPTLESQLMPLGLDLDADLCRRRAGADSAGEPVLIVGQQRLPFGRTAGFALVPTLLLGLAIGPTSTSVGLELGARLSNTRGPTTGIDQLLGHLIATAPRASPRRASMPHLRARAVIIDDSGSPAYQRWVRPPDLHRNPETTLDHCAGIATSSDVTSSHPWTFASVSPRNAAHMCEAPSDRARFAFRAIPVVPTR